MLLWENGHTLFARRFTKMHHRWRSKRGLEWVAQGQCMQVRQAASGRGLPWLSCHAPAAAMPPMGLAAAVGPPWAPCVDG